MEMPYVAGEVNMGIYGNPAGNPNVTYEMLVGHGTKEIPMAGVIVESVGNDMTIDQYIASYKNFYRTQSLVRYSFSGSTTNVLLAGKAYKRFTGTYPTTVTNPSTGKPVNISMQNDFYVRKIDDKVVVIKITYFNYSGLDSANVLKNAFSSY